MESLRELFKIGKGPSSSQIILLNKHWVSKRLFVLKVIVYLIIQMA